MGWVASVARSCPPHSSLTLTSSLYLLVYYLFYSTSKPMSSSLNFSSKVENDDGQSVREPIQLTLTGRKQKVVWP